MSSRRTALLFPGQAAHGAEAMRAMEVLPSWIEHRALATQVLGHDPLTGPDLDANVPSSLIAVLASAVCLARYRAETRDPEFAVAGHSVGQWSALYAAGSLDLKTLVRVIAERGRLMDEAIAGTPSGMFAVLGVTSERLEAVLAGMRAAGHEVHVSAYNAPGQHTIGGAASAIDVAIPQLRAAGAKRLVRLPVAGAWHTRLLSGAAERFGRFLRTIELRPPGVPVADNVTGGLLPTDGDELRAHLSLHLTRPVRWDPSIRALIRSGAERMIEIGYGTVLTRFGTFIDRTVEHAPVLPEPGRSILPSPGA